MLCEVNTVNIKSLNSTYNLKATNPLNKKNNHNQNPSFSGCVLTQDTAGNNIYKIFVPNAPQGTKVEYVTMKKIKTEYTKHIQNLKQDICQQATNH